MAEDGKEFKMTMSLYPTANSDPTVSMSPVPMSYNYVLTTWYDVCLGLVIYRKTRQT